MTTPRERDLLDDLMNDFESGKLDGVRRKPQPHSGSFFSDFDREFRSTQRFVKGWFIFVAFFAVALFAALLALAFILLSHFNVI